LIGKYPGLCAHNLAGGFLWNLSLHEAAPSPGRLSFVIGERFTHEAPPLSHRHIYLSHGRNFENREGFEPIGEGLKTVHRLRYNPFMDNPKLHIEYVATDLLKPASYNPRIVSEKTFNDMKNSLTKFGWAEPIVVNKRTATIVGGHLRLQAAIALNMEQVPVVYVDLDPKSERALNIALNKISGEFDENMLAELIADLEDLTTFTGFGEDELAKLQADPFDEDADEMVEVTKPKVDRWTAEQLRILAKSYHPVEADTILDFIAWLEQHGKRP
jgi:ParB-like nuclease domain